MKITDIEVHILQAPDTGRPHWVSHFIVPRANEILVKIKTNEGVEGFGIATSYTPIRLQSTVSIRGSPNKLSAKIHWRPKNYSKNYSQIHSRGLDTRRVGVKKP